MPGHDTFLCLPPELRNRIYDLTVLFDKPLELYERHTRARIATEPPLLLVCRQVREEASSIFYAGNTFYTGSEYLTTRFICHLGAKKTAMLRAIRAISEVAWREVVYRNVTIVAPADSQCRVRWITWMQNKGQEVLQVSEGALKAEAVLIKVKSNAITRKELWVPLPMLSNGQFMDDCVEMSTDAVLQRFNGGTYEATVGVAPDF